jgi:hypothetical protein
MATQASTNLNRLLRLLTNLLFEKGEDPNDVSKLVSGFVAPNQVRLWYDRYCLVNGISRNENRKKQTRMPMPPISWDEVTVKSLDEMLLPETPEQPEPEW